MSDAFLPAGAWMKYQLVGDGFKIMSFILASLAIVQGKTKNLFYIELVSATILLGGGYIAASYFGARGLVILHAIRYFIYCSYWIFVFRNMLFQNPNKST
jgi:PST family polysaccharide transporter